LEVFTLITSTFTYITRNSVLAMSCSFDYLPILTKVSCVNYLVRAWRRLFFPLSLVILFIFLLQFLISSSFAFLPSRFLPFSQTSFWCYSPYFKSHLRTKISMRWLQRRVEKRSLCKNSLVAALQINDKISVIGNVLQVITTSTTLV
jgi:hypothetical protein